MTHTSSARLSPALIVFLVFLLSGCAITNRENVFLGVVERNNVVLSCDGGAMLDTACQLEMGNPSTKHPVRFSTERTRYAPLFVREVKRVLEDHQSATKPTASEAKILQSLLVEDCHPAERSKGMSGDFLQLCIPPDASAVVLFFRGLCDRCNFEPVVMKRKTEQ
jgi:hypothetical protein